MGRFGKRTKRSGTTYSLRTQCYLPQESKIVVHQINQLTLDW
jgi:hypothetical protein